MTGAGLPDSCRTARFAGLITTAELEAAGLTDTKVRTLVRQGVLMLVRRGVYADVELASRLTRDDPHPDRLLGVAAAVAAAGAGAVASHEDAALVHGLALLDRPPAGTYSVSFPASAIRGRSARPSTHVRTSILPSCHLTVAKGIPVTSVARTVIDLSRTKSFKAGVVVADSALHQDLTSPAELDAVIDDCPRWPGIVQARKVARFSNPLAESAFESIGRVAFRDGGLPPPMLQVWVAGPTGMIGRVDFLWQDHFTIAETDGAMKYADPNRAREQLRRDAALRRAGYEVVHITWREMTATPEQVIQSVRTAFARSARLGRRPASRAPRPQAASQYRHRRAAS